MRPHEFDYRYNPENIETVMKFYGFQRSEEKPGYWVKSARNSDSDILVRHRTVKRWAVESSDLRKRVKDEIGRLLRTNPERFKSLAQKYAVSKDPDEAVRFADEYLRYYDIEPKSEYAQMNVAEYCISDQPWFYDLETRNSIWDWIWDRANFQHVNKAEAILHIKDPTVPFANGLTSETKRLLFRGMPDELAPIIDQALKLGYEYIAFYA